MPCDHSFAHTVGIYAALFRGISLYFVDARGGGMAILRNIPTNLAETNPTFLLNVPSLTGNFMKKIKAGIKEKGNFLQMLFDWGVSNAVSYYGNGYNRPPLSTRLSTFLPYKLVDLLLFRQVLTEAFTEENQMINSTMKMVRYKIIRAHWHSLEYMYTEEGKHFLNPGNRAAVSTLFPQLKS